MCNATRSLEQAASGSIKIDEISIGAPSFQSFSLSFPFSSRLSRKRNFSSGRKLLSLESALSFFIEKFYIYRFVIGNQRARINLISDQRKGISETPGCFSIEERDSWFHHCPTHLPLSPLKTLRAPLPLSPRTHPSLRYFKTNILKNTSNFPKLKYPETKYSPFESYPLRRWISVEGRVSSRPCTHSSVHCPRT